ncbi:ecotropic viral integration site 5 protein homolog isoform X3 [Myxocyprinus asiaticus]|uniref:ecotropic viral integration site 5 protein homolog isoform X3 n=1 Tax=Myxocyprinus asiaticus TaxID=70543 RepID=UPI0022228891|nr:ecotropic viral integration site 5 protein homolog isoform X3 [Myxocyprinus asiaticus]
MDFSSTVPPLSPSLGSPLSPDEMKLLAKLEEQNRLLETDSKSLYSVNGVVKSPSSPKIFSFEEDTWGNVVKEWDDWSKRKVGQLKELIRRGIPAHLRAVVWQLLCDAQNVSARQQYSELLTISSPSKTLIHRDLKRILPQYLLFQNHNSTSQEALFNVLKAYSVLDREIGYCQGSVFIVGLLITQMSEEEAFCVFVRLMKDFRMRELYRSSMVELGCCIHQLDSMIQEQLPELHSHFQTQGFHTSMFSSSWFLNILLSSLPLAAALRIFDIFMCEGLEIVFRVGLAILHMKQTELVKLDEEGMVQSFCFQCLQNLESQDLDPDRMVKAAFQIKYNPRKMKQLRKDYASIKAKELEEQEELNGLFRENKHLKQRLDILEKRCSEKLVSQLKKELENTWLNEAKSHSTLKEMKAKILQIKENELISSRLREAEALTGLKELKQHIKDLESKWQRQQEHCGGQQKVVSVQNELQVDLLSARLKETLAQAALKESHHRLLQLQTENEILINQLKRIKMQVSSQQEHLEQLTSQNQDLHNHLQQSRQQFVAYKQNPEEKQIEEAGNMATIADLQKQITELQTQQKKESQTHLGWHEAEHTYNGREWAQSINIKIHPA